MPKLRFTRSLVLPPFVATQPRHATSHSLIVAIGAIPVNLAEISEDPLNEVHGIRALRMTRPLDSNPRRRGNLRLLTNSLFLFAHRYLAP
jgi:hypothetical protein